MSDRCGVRPSVNAHKFNWSSGFETDLNPSLAISLMSLPDDLAADLPPPRDDEPASLRRDIVDELADHLACALARERQRDGAVPSAAETPAWQRVLNRFGSPPAIALQLWREAMQESLAMQRILTGAGIVTLGAICVGMFLMVRSVNEQQQAMLVQQREMAEILQQLRARADRPEPSAAPSPSIEWVPVEISLSAVDPGRKLPPGFLVRLQIQSTVSSVPPWSATTAETSKVQFPLVHYGVYTLMVEAPWGEYVTKDVTVSPGTPLVINVLCPDVPLESLTLKPELVLPEALRQRPFSALLTVGSGQREVGDSAWLNTSDEADAQVLIGADGRLRPFTESDAESLKRYVVYDEAGTFSGLRWPDRSVRPTASVEFRLDQLTTNGDNRLLYLMDSSFEFGRDLRFKIADDRRLLIEPTEAGLEKLTALLARIDKGEENFFTGVSLPSLPEQRP